ncbi:MAG: hypothetical protein FJ098_00630 [Deltaproteobacteria bacterium]|nr:hypothetical protein [Deltaproteobacteria bacterium]
MSTSTRAVRTFDLPDPPGVNAPGAGTRAHWHLPAGDAGAGSTGVVILPIQGGDYEICTLFAKHFAAQGHHCLRFERRADWLDPERPPAALAALMRAFRDDVRRGMDRWLEEAPPGLRLGLFGVSMGAMAGVLVAASEPRLRATVLVLGGGPLAEILGSARDPEINRFRATLAARLGCREAELVPPLRDALEGLDPLEHAGALDPASTLVVSARFDRVVRYRYQVRLWEALGRPRRRVLPCGHYSAAIFVPWIRRMASRWFQDRLAPPGDWGTLTPRAGGTYNDRGGAS